MEIIKKRIKIKKFLTPNQKPVTVNINMNKLDYKEKEVKYEKFKIINPNLLKHIITVEY